MSLLTGRKRREETFDVLLHIFRTRLWTEAREGLAFGVAQELDMRQDGVLQTLNQMVHINMAAVQIGITN